MSESTLSSTLVRLGFLRMGDQFLSRCSRVKSKRAHRSDSSLVQGGAVHYATNPRACGMVPGMINLCSYTGKLKNKPTKSNADLPLLLKPQCQCQCQCLRYSHLFFYFLFLFSHETFSVCSQRRGRNAVCVPESSQTSMNLFLVKTVLAWSPRIMACQWLHELCICFRCSPR